jgi:hypothetical protein
MQAFWYRRLLLKDEGLVQRLAGTDSNSALAFATSGNGVFKPAAVAAAVAAAAPADPNVAAAKSEGGEEEGEHKQAASAGDWRRLQMLLCQLRKACNHPYLFKGAETADETDIEEMVEASGKLQVCRSVCRPWLLND